MINVTKEEWITALESGRFPQAVGYLNVVDEKKLDLTPVRNNGFCCLGVLCELAKFETREQNDGLLSYGVPVVYFDDDEIVGDGSRWCEAEVPSKLVSEVLRLDVSKKISGRGDRNLSVIDFIMQMNDSGRSFAEIAQYLRELPEGKHICEGDL